MRPVSGVIGDIFFEDRHPNSTGQASAALGAGCLLCETPPSLTAGHDPGDPDRTEICIDMHFHKVRGDRAGWCHRLRRLGRRARATPRQLLEPMTREDTGV